MRNTNVRNINYRDVFANNTPEALINAVNKGLPVYLEDFRGKSFHWDWDGPQTFFEAAIRYGTPELVRACVEMGADVNCVSPKKARCTSCRSATSSLLAAMNSFNPETLRALLESGARVGILNGVFWDLERNLLPEAEESGGTAKEIKRRLDTGAEILKILRGAGFRVPGTDKDGDGMSFYSASPPRFGYGRPREDDGNGAVKKYTVWEDWGGEYADDGDEHNRYCECLEEFESSYSDPLHGTRPGALWHAASPEALKRMIESGADVNASDAAGWSALHHVISCCDDDYYFNPYAMVQILLDYGADIDRRGRYGLTPLHMAAMRVKYHPRAIEIVKLLLKNGAAFGATSDNGASALHWIRDYYDSNTNVERESLQEILYEIYRSARPDKADAGEKAGELPYPRAADIDLMTAAFWGTAEELALILARGADVNARSKNGYTPLMFASVWNHAPVVKFLIGRGADVRAKDAEGATALMFAIRAGKEDNVTACVDLGAGINDADECGVTPLMHHLYSGHSAKILEFLIQRGADVNARDEDGDSPLIAAAEHGSEFIEALLNAGAKVDERNAEGRTPLDLLLNGYNGKWSGAEDYASLLLARGANPRLMTAPQKSEYEETKEEIAWEFSEYGLKAHASFEDVFADNDASALVKAVSAGLSLTLEDKDYLSFYQAALLYGSPEAVKACLDAGANADMGWTRGYDLQSFKKFPPFWPLSYAVKGHNAGAVKTLVEAGADVSNIGHFLHWRLRANVFPENAMDNEEAQKFEARLAAGADILKILRGAGSDVPYKDSKGRILTYIDVRERDMERETLIAEEETGGDLTEMRRAASSGALKLLLAAGADVNARDNDGRTITHFIARDAGDYFDPDGMIRLLIKAGADANARDREGVTPLMLAADIDECPALEVIAALAEGGAKFDAKDKHERSVRSRIGQSRFKWGALERTLYKELAAVIERACKRGGKEAKEKEAKGKERRAAALMMAACYGDEKKIEETLALGADVNVRSGQGYTPLMIASVFNTAAAVKFLIRRGANLETRYVHGRTALHFAALSYRSDPKIVSALAEAGANVNAIDSDGYTSLMLAAYDTVMKQAEDTPKDYPKVVLASYDDCETGEVAQILVSAGADIGIKRNSGKDVEEDALSIALDRKYFRVVRVLLAAGAKLRAWAEKSSETLGGGEVLSETAAILQRHGLKV